MTWTLSKTLRHLLHSRAHLPGFLPLAPSSSSLSPHPTAGMICYELISILRKICVVLYHRHQLVCFTSSLPPSILHCSLFPPSLATRTLGLASRKVVISRNNLTPRAHVTADCLACLLQLSVLMCVARLQQRKSLHISCLELQYSVLDLLCLLLARCKLQKQLHILLCGGRVVGICPSFLPPNLFHSAILRSLERLMIMNQPRSRCGGGPGIVWIAAKDAAA